MNKVSFLLARRYILASAYEGNISTMVYICFIGITIATCSLSLITAVMNGFETAIHQKMQGIHAQATIASYESPINVDAVAYVLNKEFPDVVAYSPHIVEHAIIQPADSDQETSPTVVLLKAIDPCKEILVSSIENKIVTETSLTDAVCTNHILIGKGLAKQNGVSVGDTIALYYLEQTGKRKATIHEVEAVVGGIFSTGIDEFDNNLIYCSMDFMKQLFPSSSIKHIQLKFAPHANEMQLITQLQQRLLLDVYSWKELYPALVSALKLEKYAMFFILLLVTLVASMNIISLLYMLITQKRGDIAILYAMGASSNLITRIFMLIGFLLTTTATLLGLGLSVILSCILERYPFITLPDAYYVTHLPAKLDMGIIALVFVAVIILGLLATWIPTRRTKTISIADVLRFEG